MANDEHLAILKQGTLMWNSWRKENPKMQPYLRDASLMRASLTYANLREADLVRANLWHADLFCADLGGASLPYADLRRAHLRDANLRSADLRSADLSRANLDNTNLSRAVFAFTAVSDINLSAVVGIEDVVHSDASPVSTSTLERTAHGLAKNPSRQGAVEVFLRGAGVEEHMIRYFRSMIGNPIEFYSCFISYSHADKAFARRMYDSLQGRGIRCWLDEHDATVGTPIQDAIDRGFKMTEKVLLCCSEHSITSTWVLREVTKAFTKEEQLSKKSGKPCYVLIPLDVDGHLFKKDVGGGFIWDHGWSDEVRNRIAADFKGWKEDNNKFEAQFERVVKALKADEAMAEVQRGE